jgi:hypothetical protein
MELNVQPFILYFHPFPHFSHPSQTHPKIFKISTMDEEYRCKIRVIILVIVMLWGWMVDGLMS